jgi:hypothetical protein
VNQPHSNERFIYDGTPPALRDPRTTFADNFRVADHPGATSRRGLNRYANGSLLGTTRYHDLARLAEDRPRQKMAFRFIMSPRKVNSPGISLCILRLIIVSQDESREQRCGVVADD